MATTTRDAVHRGIITDLEAGADLTVNDVHIYTALQPRFTAEADTYVQLVPGQPRAKHGRSGVGLMEEEFEVVVWRRNLSDQRGHADIRWSDATVGVLAIMTDVRLAILQGDANTTATIPVHLVTEGVPQTSDEHPGWVFVADRYRVGYELVWP